VIVDGSATGNAAVNGEVLPCRRVAGVTGSESPGVTRNYPSRPFRADSTRCCVVPLFCAAACGSFRLFRRQTGNYTLGVRVRSRVRPGMLQRDTER
jgi:hypothetical protein